MLLIIQEVFLLIPFYLFFGGVHHKASGILVFPPGIKPTPLALESEVLTTEQPGKSLLYLY